MNFKVLIELKSTKQKKEFYYKNIEDFINDIINEQLIKEEYQQFIGWAERLIDHKEKNALIEITHDIIKPDYNIIIYLHKKEISQKLLLKYNINYESLDDYIVYDSLTNSIDISDNNYNDTENNPEFDDKDILTVFNVL